MSAKSDAPQITTEAEDGTTVVPMLHPDGERAHGASTPAEVYQLNALGYRLPDGVSVDAAAEALMDTPATKAVAKRKRQAGTGTAPGTSAGAGTPAGTASGASA